MNNLFTIKRPSRPRAVVATAVVLPLLALLAACGSGTDSKSSASASAPSTAVDSKAAGLLPDSIKSSKILRVAIPTNEPPTQYYKEGTKEMTGINPDIARLIGDALGVDVQIEVANFDSIIPGLAAGRYDMTVSSMTPTAERMKVLEFVDYLSIGNSIAVAKGNPVGVKDEHGLCGKRVGFLTASYQLTTHVPEYNKECAGKGEKDIATFQYQDTRQAISALTSGRLDAVLADSPIMGYAATQNPQIEVVANYGVDPVGVGMPKSSGLIKAVGPAVAAVIKSQGYAKVLSTYGIESAAITDARVNFAQ
ncbi:transporter substrate-binding domain-containing protein [Nonomuraea sp. NEAU-A123]|uniref:transporter substrate-binding domain-containing protein n=1 Tax=Nonomuraea sp. NEAU-A123 TaxID=2839649 RepID=UPI001BE42251|nr:transporter substrate-binding domain-containing protein [Nonomuraea sp. NEAU-A123]MBT2232135.1 transporter substrate-binding domain-containing protein [Nonomuraea sp. NEAU-A123]